MANKGVDLGLIPLETVWEEAKTSMEEYGRTELYSTGDKVMDVYLGNSTKGGFGRQHGYEIITIFGDTGRNKSTFATNFIIDPLKKGKTVVYMALEDDPKDVAARLIKMGEDPKKLPGKLLFFKEQSGYTLSEMSKSIEEIFQYADVVLIDPLQFIYEASVTEKGETEFNRQRLFMREMNCVMKKTDKILIIVSHTNKSNKNDSPGLSHIMGSSAIAQASTKVIEIGLAKDGTRFIHCWKNRFVPIVLDDMAIKLDNMRIKSMLDSEKDKMEMINRWLR